MDAMQNLGNRLAFYSGTPATTAVKRSGKTGVKEKPEKTEKTAEKAGTTEEREDFANLRDFTDYLRENYTTVKSGVAVISRRFLRDCLADGAKRRSLFENLEAADQMAQDAPERLPGFQSMKVTIDEEGNMTTETVSRRVGFNGEKMARRIRAARSKNDMTAIMATLQNDLSVCQDGLRDGACDEAEVAKVKAMIQAAEKRLAELSGVPEEPGDRAAFVDVII
ncbi:MAG: hypothetical protein IJS96_06725 [Schwartzia sp.]|nr:hypothetical protein [Schwartzia sp. (in: firmicutes)]